MNEWMPCSNLKRKSPAKAKKRVILPHVNYRRIFIRGFGVAILLILAVVIVKKTVRPFALCYGEASSAGEINRELRDLREENRVLAQKRTYLASREGALTEARKLGWVNKGERGIVISNGETAEESSLPPVRRHEGLMTRIGNKLKL
jgi:hypothetical protein